MNREIRKTRGHHEQGLGSLDAGPGELARVEEQPIDARGITLEGPERVRADCSGLSSDWNPAVAAITPSLSEIRMG